MRSLDYARDDISILLIKCSSNVNGASNCTTYHWVVTDAEEFSGVSHAARFANEASYS